jgi:hypothetical protein
VLSRSSPWWPVARRNRRQNRFRTRAPGGRGTPEGCQADKLGDEALIGKTEAEAAALLKGCAWRFGSRDGQSLPATMDYNPQRRSIDVVGGKVTAVRRG